MTLVVHHHIFKNAGTTIDWILQRNFPGQVLHVEGADPGARLKPSEVRAAAAPYPDHRAISSHSFPLPSPREAWAPVHLSVLRDPIERYASIYRFECSREIDHPANRAAHELGFDGFCRWWLENASGIWTNWQTRCCTPQVGLGVISGLIKRTAGLKRRVFRTASRQGDYVPGWDGNLRLALRTALRTGFVFTLDRFDQGLVLLEERLEALGNELDASYIRQNVTRDASKQGELLAESLEPGLQQQLISANSLDYELLRRVRQEVDARYSALDPKGARLAAFRERCERLSSSPSRPAVRIPGQANWILVQD